MKKIVIIGGVAGGASCAARLRRLDENADIVVFERGEYISFANCGLPYHIGDVIKSRDALLLQTPEKMKEKYNIDVRIKSEVISINREAKTVTVKQADTGNEYEETYDSLVISTGSSPVRTLMDGINTERIQTLTTIPDTDKIIEVIKKNNVKSVAVVGGGYIGLEMAENLRHINLDVSLIQSSAQVMGPLDFEMAQLVHQNILQNGTKLYLGDRVHSLSSKDNVVTVTLKSGNTVSADLVILSVGVRPNSELAKLAGLKLNEKGAIVVDDFLRTSDENIYAVGDVIEVEEFVLGARAVIPLAGPANKQGRIAANNIYGANESYNGTQGSSIAKIFDLTAATTGVNEKSLIKAGKKKGVDYESLIITQNSHAGYYPGSVPMTIKLLFSCDGKRIFGAQIVGLDGVDKRIDTIAVAIRLSASVSDLKQLELAYAPPYSSAKDPVNMAGFVAENMLNKLVAFSDWNVEKKHADAVLLDVREDAELMAFAIPNAKHIPLGELRARLGEIDKTKEIITICAVGVRAYNAARILMQNGFENVKVYPGGIRFYESTHYSSQPMLIDNVKKDKAENEISSPSPVNAIRVDCSGMQCPGPIMKVFETIKDMKDGEILEVSASDPGFVRDIAAWCRRTGNTLVSSECKDGDYTACVQKCTTQKANETVVQGTPQGKTIIVFSGDLDKVLASFIIANGAAAMGRPVTMFFTFWGLTALRKAQKQPVKKSFMESMFGAMLPRGTKKLKLSKMNMGGMGTAMMKKIMNDKNVDSLEVLIEKAIESGVKIVACTMSMDVMGIKKEELIDGVELGGVGAYLGDAEESSVNLFVS